MVKRSQANRLAAALALLVALPLAGCQAEAPVAGCVASAPGCPCDDTNPCASGLACDGGRCVVVGAPDAGLLDAEAAADGAAAQGDAADAHMDAGASDAGTGAADGQVLGCGGLVAADLCPCDADTGCASGLCAAARDGGTFCAPACDDACPEGLACLPHDAAGPIARGRCLAADLNLCTPCTSDEACGADLPGGFAARCVSYGADRGSFCGTPCDRGQDCAQGYACREVDALVGGDRIRQCVLEAPDATCACPPRALAQGAETRCEVDGCEGTRRCELGGLSACRDEAGETCAPAPPVTVGFDPQGGLIAGATTRTVAFGAPYGALPEATREGYAPAGWWTSPAGGHEVSATTRVTTREDHTLHARWVGQRLVVAFDSAGGDACPARAVTFGAAYGAEGPLCLPSRAGYAFAGWYLGDGPALEPITAEAPVATPRDHTLTARWIPVSVVVSFDAGGGSSCAARTVSFDGPYGASGPLCVPSRAGYQFAGWFTAPEPDGDLVTSASRVSLPRDHTLHARWVAATYAVTLDPGGGGPVTPPALSVTFGAAYGPLATPSRVGYRFEGWWTTPSAGGAEVRPDTRVTVAADHTLYARWAGEAGLVRFDSEGGTPCESRTVTFGAPYAAGGPALCTPTRAGYVFEGWHLGDDGTGAAISDATVVATAGNHTLYARWSAARLRVSFDSEGGTPCEDLIVTFRAAYGPLCTPTRTGHTFAGWFDGDGGTGRAVTDGTEVVLSGPHTLHARWRVNVLVVSFDSEGGSACASRPVEYGTHYGSSGALCVPFRPGYDFAGWHDRDGGLGGLVTAATIASQTDDHTLHARWTPASLTVTFASGGGTACEARVVVHGEPYGLSGPLCAPTRAGYSFGGWYTQIGSGGEAVGPTSRVTAVADHVLYARWVPRPVTVALDLRGGSGCVPEAVVTFGAPYGELCAPSRTGHVFGGWWTFPVAGVQILATTPVADPEPHALFARWAPGRWRVSFDSASGSACEPVEVAFGATYGADLSGPLCLPARPGHAFDGWWYGDAAVTAATPMLLAFDHVLVARWRPAVLTVTPILGGGSGCGAFEVTFGAPYGATLPGGLCAPTRPGWDFAGWALERGAEVLATTVVTTPESHALVASWTPRRVRVSFDAAGGSDCPPQTVVVGSPYGPLCAPARLGHDFEGWTPGDKGGLVTAETVVTDPADHTLVARWRPSSATVTYDSAGGAGCGTLTVTFGARYGASALLGALCEPRRAGHAFLGWRLGDAPVAADSPVTVAGDHTVTAAWERLGLTVTYDAAGGTPCAPFPAGTGYPYGLEGPLCTPSRVGHSFAGWWSGAGASGRAVTAATLVEASGDHVIHGAWTPRQYSVAFDAGEGDAPSPPGLVVTFGQPYDALAVTSRVGHAFAGWWSGPDGAGIEVLPASLVARAEPHTLYARWRPERYPVSFDSAGGSACASREVTFGAPYGPLCAPTRTGWSFAGWRSAPGGGGDARDADSEVATPAPHTLYAAWTANRYAVTLDSEGGSVCAALSATFGATYGEAAEGGVLCVPVRAGQIFGGWFAGDDGTGARVVEASVVSVAAAHTLHARWTPTAMPTFLRLEPATYMAGAPSGEAGRDTHEQQAMVSLTRPFELAETEVTQAQWKARSGGVNATSAPGCGDACPVEQVSWWSALGYANALSLAAGLAPCYALPASRHDGASCTGSWQAGTLDCGDQWPAIAGRSVEDCAGYRLPTEAEWELAARAGTTSAIWPGALAAGAADCAVAQPALEPVAWWVCNTDRLKAVKGKLPNPWGFHDLLGNAAEWAWDAYDGRGALGGTDPDRTVVEPFDVTVQAAGLREARRVVRGGDAVSRGPGWRVPRAALREGRAAGAGRAGLRVARTLPGQARPNMRWIGPQAGDVGAPLSEAGRQSNEGQGAVALTRAFEIAETEVTQAEWRALSGGVNPAYFRAPGCVYGECPSGLDASNDRAPVEQVTWWSALAYANAVSAASGLAPCYVLPATRPDGSSCDGAWQAGTLDCGAQWPALTAATAYACDGFRLPTEAEWELAARAGTATATWQGELAGSWWSCDGGQGALDGSAWWCGNASGRTHEVASLAPNPWGLHDMLGNVWEWTWDAGDPAGAQAGQDPQRVTASAPTRVRRGGSWQDGAWYARAAYRFGDAPGQRLDPGVGLRLARTSPHQPRPEPGYRLIAPGRVTLGSLSDEVGRNTDEIRGAAALTRPFEVAETEVTQAEWRALSGDLNPSRRPGDTLPLEQLTWWSALAYANALSVASGLPPCYVLPETGCTGTWQLGTLNCGTGWPSVTGGDVYACAGYRLPTEAEWEYAARAGTTTPTWLGALTPPALDCVTPQPSIDSVACWCRNSGGGTCPVKGRPANPWGLHDVLGNVWEWTWDAYMLDWTWATHPEGVGAATGRDPQRVIAGGSSHRVAKGGSWYFDARYARAASRFATAPMHSFDSIGFRMVRTRMR
jgi:uncharacterized repeat protein (TIGR02543 family)